MVKLKRCITSVYIGVVYFVLNFIVVFSLDFK